MITVVTAVDLEYTVVRKTLPPGISVVQAGVALSRKHDRISGIAISCGVCGGLRGDLPAGTVLIPRSVRRPDGTIQSCDQTTVEALSAAARALGVEPVDAPLLTSDAIVHGADRQAWAEQGYAGVDMETGRMQADGIAAVRVILDTPQHEISPAWADPKTVIMHPRAWMDLPMMARDAPRWVKLSASIISRALGSR